MTKSEALASALRMHSTLQKPQQDQHGDRNRLRKASSVEFVYGVAPRSPGRGSLFILRPGPEPVSPSISLSCSGRFSLTFHMYLGTGPGKKRKETSVIFLAL